MKKSKKVSKKVEEIDPLDGDMSALMQQAFEKGLWKIGVFELTEKKDKVISLRLSEKLLNALQKQAEEEGLDTQKFIRLSLEKIIRKKAG